MKPEKMSKYLILGGLISFLRGSYTGYTIFGENLVYQNIKRLIKSLESSEKFKIAKVADSFADLKEYQKELEEKKEIFKANESNVLMTEDEAKKLFQIMDKLMEVIFAEARTLYVYTLTDKRYPIEILLDNIHKCFAQDIFNALPDTIQYDLKEYGKCVATECCTAGAFHVLRALEALLGLLLQNIDPSLNLANFHSWHNIVIELNKHNIPELRITCDICQKIRGNYRNPTMHPSLIYNIEEVQSLFLLCINVIDDIVGYMKAKGYL